MLLNFGYRFKSSFWIVNSSIIKLLSKIANMQRIVCIFWELELKYYDLKKSKIMNAVQNQEVTQMLFGVVKRVSPPKKLTNYAHMLKVVLAHGISLSGASLFE